MLYDKNKVDEVAKRYLDMRIRNAGAEPKDVHKFIDALDKVSGLPGVALRQCKKLGRLEKWANQHFSDKSSNIQFVGSYDGRKYDSYSIVEHIRKESGLDFTDIKILDKELGCLLTYKINYDSYISLSLLPFDLGWDDNNQEEL